MYLPNSAATFKAFKMACEILNVQVKNFSTPKSAYIVFEPDFGVLGFVPLKMRLNKNWKQIHILSHCQSKYEVRIKIFVPHRKWQVLVLCK